MAQQPQSGMKPSKGSGKGEQDAEQFRNAHSNSAMSGRDAQHSSTKNLKTEPDRARQSSRGDLSQTGK